MVIVEQGEDLPCLVSQVGQRDQGSKTPPSSVTQGTENHMLCLVNSTWFRTTGTRDESSSQHNLS